MDYDVYSNWGNWVSAAGMVGGRINHFNITKQSKVFISDTSPLSSCARRLYMQPVRWTATLSLKMWLDVRQCSTSEIWASAQIHFITCMSLAWPRIKHGH